jgi:hypothetical protein
MPKLVKNKNKFKDEAAGTFHANFAINFYYKIKSNDTRTSKKIKLEDEAVGTSPVTIPYKAIHHHTPRTQLPSPVKRLKDKVIYTLHQP